MLLVEISFPLKTFPLISLFFMLAVNMSLTHSSSRFHKLRVTPTGLSPRGNVEMIHFSFAGTKALTI